VASALDQHSNPSTSLPFLFHMRVARHSFRRLGSTIHTYLRSTFVSSYPCRTVRGNLVDTVPDPRDGDITILPDAPYIVCVGHRAAHTSDIKILATREHGYRDRSVVRAIPCSATSLTLCSLSIIKLDLVLSWLPWERKGKESRQ
jgi:hypothetical protein